ncbi:MAG: pyridoxamine 5'-phosphate oxidase family protein [Pseudonocardia sp.]|nr:pyridoxamine 5'-phosphate oxidase family protein [Pseudonocardia sp.]
MTALSPTPRSTIRRGSRRARSERAELHAVLDAGVICHLGVVIDGAPVVLPTGYGRLGDTLYLHGSTGAASLRAAAQGAPVCVTVTLVDGIVHARAVFHFSMNYRCAVVHGVPRLVTGEDERLAALRAITENIAPGAWDHARGPNRRELAATAVVALDLTEAAVKVRCGPPGDDDEDVTQDGVTGRWAGVLPLRTVHGVPEPCPLLPGTTAVPAHVSGPDDDHRR